MLEEYANFYVLHNKFLKKFVFDLDPTAEKGVGGIKLTDIMERGT